MAINLAKHIRRLVQKRDRLTRQLARKQREVDAVAKQLAVLQDAFGAPAAATPVPDADDETSLLRQVR